MEGEEAGGEESEHGQVRGAGEKRARFRRALQARGRARPARAAERARTRGDEAAASAGTFCGMPRPVTGLFLVFVSTVACAPAPPPRPNVVVIVADDLGFADVGWQSGGDPAVRTPNLDGLAAQGVILERYATAPLCTPARAGLMTGRNPLRMGLWRNLRADDSAALPAQERTIAEDFRAAGYATALVGKWHLGHADAASRPLARGFERAYGPLGGWIDYTTHRRHARLDWQRDGRDLEEPGYATDLLADEAVRTIREHEGARPLFLWLAFTAPHTPLHVPPGREAEAAANGADARSAYLWMVESLDRAVGRVVSALDDAGIAERTLVVFVSDNGGDLRYGARNAPFAGGKYETLEGGIRAPALVRWPGVLAPGRFAPFATHLDVAPTLAAAAGVALDARERVDGRDLWPHLLRRTTPDRTAFAVGCERPDELRVAVTDGAAKLRASVDRATGAERRVQSDLSADPRETTDVLGRAPAPWFQADERTRLETWLALPRIPSAGDDGP